MSDTPLLELENISKFYGNIIALQGVTTEVRAGQVTCVLGDNGAGKSTFIKILAGVHEHSEGTFKLEGQEVNFKNPREALNAGIAAVYQDLAMVPLMSVWRNFFLGSEPTKGVWPLEWIDKAEAKRIAKERWPRWASTSIPSSRSARSPAVNASPSPSPARCTSAKVLILDEPTSALGVKQSGVVLRYVVEAARRGLGVIFITHNPNHAYPVGDRFVILNRSQSMGNFAKEDISQNELTS